MLTYADICDFGRSPIRENAICARGIGLSGLPHEKCSDDFLAKPLICLWSTIDSAQVGLTFTYLPVVVHSDDGTPLEIPDAVCIFERNIGNPV